MLSAVDDHGESVLVLLDMSAAFDTIDHNILLFRLQDRYGVSCTVCRWFAYYFDNGQQSEQSDCMHITWGMPQGSVVSPEIFVAYSAPIEDIVNVDNLYNMPYADDTQLYVLIKPSDRTSKLPKLECIYDIRAWLTENKVKLNDAETELLHVKSHYVKIVSNKCFYYHQQCNQPFYHFWKFVTWAWCSTIIWWCTATWTTSAAVYCLQFLTLANFACSWIWTMQRS